MVDCWVDLQVSSYRQKTTVPVLSVGRGSSFRELSSADSWGTYYPAPNIPSTVIYVVVKSDFKIGVSCWLLGDLLLINRILPRFSTCWLLIQFLSCTLEEAQTTDRCQIADFWQAKTCLILHQNFFPLELNQTSREVSLDNCWEKYYQTTKCSPYLPPDYCWDSSYPVRWKSFRQLIGVKLMIFEKPSCDGFLTPTVLLLE